MKNYTQAQLNKRKQRINRAIDKLCAPILAAYAARMEAHRQDLLQRLNKPQIQSNEQN